MEYRYKSFRRIGKKLFSWYDTDDEWSIGQWKKLRGKIKLCKNGFHACPSPNAVRRFTLYGVIAKVEVRGRYDRNARQEAWSEMRIVKLIL